MESAVHASINYTGAMSERPRFHASIEMRTIAYWFD